MAMSLYICGRHIGLIEVVDCMYLMSVKDWWVFFVYNDRRCAVPFGGWGKKTVVIRCFLDIFDMDNFFSGAIVKLMVSYNPSF